MRRLDRVRRLVSAVQRRERLAEATRLLTEVALPAGLLLAALGLATMHRWGTEQAPLTYLPWLGLVPVPLALLWAAFRPRAARNAARRLDRHYGLHDLLGGALELAAQPPTDDPRSADIVALLTADADAAAANIDPRPVVPLPRPGARALLLGWAGALAVLGAMFVPPAPTPELLLEPKGDRSRCGFILDS